MWWCWTVRNVCSPRRRTIRHHSGVLPLHRHHVEAARDHRDTHRQHRKDLDRGARGTSGKRDGVDVELFMTVESGKISIKPGKIRLPDVESITIEKQIADDGRIYYDTARDPYRAKINDAIAALDRYHIQLDTGMARCYDLLKGLGEVITREALRAAIKERRYLAKTAQT
jgi:hypothetical protein